MMSRPRGTNASDVTIAVGADAPAERTLRRVTLTNYQHPPPDWDTNGQLPLDGLGRRLSRLEGVILQHDHRTTERVGPEDALQDVATFDFEIADIPARTPDTWSSVVVNRDEGATYVSEFCLRVWMLPGAVDPYDAAVALARVTAEAGAPNSTHVVVDRRTNRGPNGSATFYRSSIKWKSGSLPPGAFLEWLADLLPALGATAASFR